MSEGRTEPTREEIQAFQLDVELALFAKRLRESQITIPPDVGALLNKHFWDALEDEPMK